MSQPEFAGTAGKATGTDPTTAGAEPGVVAACCSGKSPSIAPFNDFWEHKPRLACACARTPTHSHWYHGPELTVCSTASVAGEPPSSAALCWRACFSLALGPFYRWELNLDHGCPGEANCMILLKRSHRPSVVNVPRAARFAALDNNKKTAQLGLTGWISV